MRPEQETYETGSRKTRDEGLERSERDGGRSTANAAQTTEATDGDVGVDVDDGVVEERSDEGVDGVLATSQKLWRRKVKVDVSRRQETFVRQG